jgi:hypothetical protein
MSLRLAIPWRVGLHQSPPPLRQPTTILMEKRLFEKEKFIKRQVCQSRIVSTEGFTPSHRGKTVSKLFVLELLGLLLSKKQIPPIVENNRSVEN